LSPSALPRLPSAAIFSTAFAQQRPPVLTGRPGDDAISITDLPLDEQDPGQPLAPKSMGQSPVVAPQAPNIGGIDYGTLMPTRGLRPNLAFPFGQEYSVMTTAGHRILVWKAPAGTPQNQTYWCHGFAFGGTTAPGGPYSIFSGPSVAILLADAYTNIPRAANAMVGDIIVWYGKGGPIHSAVLTDIVLTRDMRFDTNGTKLDSKNGVNPFGNFTLAQIVAMYGTAIRVYRLNAGQAPAEQFAGLIGVALAAHKKGADGTDVTAS
jgi:hypothetical protein